MALRLSCAYLCLLGILTSDDSITSSEEVECRIGKASGVFARLKECAWKQCNISLKTKMKVYNAVVITTLLYAFECWTLLATVAWISPPLGSVFSGIVFDGLDMCAEWTIPTCRNSFYGQNVRMVGAVLLMHQGNNQVAADVTTHLFKRVYRDLLMAAARMTTECGAWQGLRYDITGINRRRDQSSEHAHPDVSSVMDKHRSDPIFGVRGLSKSSMLI